MRGHWHACRTKKTARITRDPLPEASKVTRVTIDVRSFGTMYIENYYEVSVLK